MGDSEQPDIAWCVFCRGDRDIVFSVAWQGWLWSLCATCAHDIAIDHTPGVTSEQREVSYAYRQHRATVAGKENWGEL